LKLNARFLVPALLPVLLVLAPAAFAQPQPASQNQSLAQQARTTTAKAEHMDAPESGPNIEEYRHSSVVQAIARYGHVSTETAAQIFEDFNSGVLLFVIAYFLWKFVPGMLRGRSEKLRKELVGARHATDEANRRLAEVEARLLRLDTEIDALRQQVEQEAAHDQQRIHATLEAERQRIVASAEQEIGALQAAAQRELKKFAADLAIDNAMRRIQLTADTDRTLIRDFGKRLGRNNNSGGEA